MPVKVDASVCPQDHTCPAADICPTSALIQEGMAAPTVDDDLCTDCGICVEECPEGAISL